MNETPIQHEHNEFPIPYVTFGLVAINVLVFLLMLMDGAGFFDAHGIVHIGWGSNFAPLTLSGEGWRLLTSLFLHFGVLHLVMNMYALGSIGLYLEPLLGKIKFLLCYLCCGVFASLVSLGWHHPPVNSAGASGAIFGIYGLFFALLSVTKLIPGEARTPLLINTTVFLSYNLIYGINDGVDNAAHIGGLISGLVFGYTYVYCFEFAFLSSIRKWITPMMVIFTIVSSLLFLESYQESQDVKQHVLAELKEARYKDWALFNEKIEAFSAYDERAFDFPFDENTQGEEFGRFITQISDPAFQKAEDVLIEMQQLEVSDQSKEKIKLLTKYLRARKKGLQLLEKYYRTQDESLAFDIKKNNTLVRTLLKKIDSL